MLILTRQIGQSIMIGDDITITILGNNKGNSVRLGIDAPKDVSVHREEIFMKVKAEENTPGKVTDNVEREEEGHRNDRRPGI